MLLSSLKFAISTVLLVVIIFSASAYSATLPLNTGYDYSSFNTYSFGANDDYWIRIASYPTMAVGPSWAVQNFPLWANPLPGPTGIPSTWINAFGGTMASPAGSSSQNPAYAIFRKCFCLPAGYKQPSIRGSVRNDEAIQMWLNTMLNPVLATSPINLNGTPYTVAYNNASGFRTGKNCLYAIVEDTGVHTGFNFAGNLTVSGVTPMIAKGSNMSFAPCACAQGPIKSAVGRGEQDEDDSVVKQLVQAAEAKRVEIIRKEIPKN